ncbi:uncharacterized protein K460DRAFT_36400 [Cucurbitaria berberidis CBS 394.84]|uniref:Secreted protein n=1 Tax=Cucurbitaria berberidis CBS 394.84 TaxID=1168544 RepID=A0A9P4GU31_9PLEO|nr:uncharacterized protein K460DRAFT_36400 [Cucurbitaria berberidis CBS 394.84]KAF1851519.1 hypothetical protein K460DRAFT_36400 [Cucurbitaria berberidis CBS 394.84]
MLIRLATERIWLLYIAVQTSALECLGLSPTIRLTAAPSPFFEERVKGGCEHDQSDLVECTNGEETDWLIFLPLVEWAHAAKALHTVRAK